MAIYGFARTADDLADEGDLDASHRLEQLALFRRDLLAIASTDSHSGRWPEVFDPLTCILQQFALPVPLLDALLLAFEQDVTKTRDGSGYATQADLLDYCSRSANPVGRLLLHLYNVHDAASLQQSDAICSALQLINFWQDLSQDMARQRYYLPQDALAEFGITHFDLLSRGDTAASAALIRHQCDLARGLMHQGSDLVHRLPGRAGWELRWVVQAGLRILDKLAHADYRAMRQRPQIRAWDLPLTLWRAMRMSNGSTLRPLHP